MASIMLLSTNVTYESVNYTSENTTDNASFVWDYFASYDSVTYPVPLKTVPTWEMSVKITVYALIILLAIAGNVLIITVVALDRTLKTTTNYFIVNLAVSDLLVTACCTWVRLVDDLTEGWILGTFFCKINSFAQVMSMVAGIFSLVLIACDRFFGIVFAMKAHIIERKASYSIIVIWVCAIAVATPLLLVRQEGSRVWADHVEIWCGDTWPAAVTSSNGTVGDISFPGRKAYYTFLTIALYFVPMVTMTVMYTVIIATVWFTRAPGERVSVKEIKVQRRVKIKVVKMLVMILATFGLCWLPLQVVILHYEYKNKLEMMPKWFHIVEFVSYTLAYANSAINPLIYAGFNENFRKGFRTLFQCGKKQRYSAISRADSMYTTSFTGTTHVTRF